ncbi:MAG: hypothetical protein JO208_03070 [Alphaproteobacteria bacterium]|nr:hypothetical protein [Alphaproteobacteria bacterium]
MSGDLLTKSARRPRTKREAWPRGLRRLDAADYVGVSPSQFDKWVDDGTMPKPTKKGGIALWDRHALDDAMDRLFYPEADQSEWDNAF